MQNIFTNKRGFTLIELLVVIAIIGLLASIITVSLVSSKAKGRDAKRISDIKTLQLALETYYNDNGYYPTTIYSSGISPSFSPAYMTTVPKDPSDNSTPYKYSAYNSGGITNCGTSNPIRYHLAAVAESDDGALGAPGPKNLALGQDNDWAGWASYGGGNPCTGSTNNFNGYSVGGATGCSGTGLGAYDACYDVTN